MVRMGHEKRNLTQRVNRQNIDGRTYGEKPPWHTWTPRSHRLSKLNRTAVSNLYTKLVKTNRVDEEKAFGIVRDEMFRLIERERNNSNMNRSKSGKRKRNRRKR